MRLALAQINTTVGDLDGNRARILERIAEAKGSGADIVLFPELAITGYPPEDLLLRPSFVRAAERSLAQVARETRGIVAFVGVPHLDRDLYNACAVCAGGEVKALYRKRFLPNYGVFDEHRYFAPGRDLVLLDEQMLATRARHNVCYVAFVNAVGGQDELVFDGHSVVLDDDGRVLARAPGFEEALLVVDVEPEEAVGRRLRDVRRRSLESEREEAPEVPVIHLGSGHASNGQPPEPKIAPLLDDLEQMRLALELGLGDYVRKNGFEEVVVGISGGIDSALTAAIACEALGADRVHCVSMPSRYSSDETRRDARALAEALGAPFLELPIETIVEGFHATLADVFAGREADITEENLQARIRGVLLMALSNKFGWLVVATGNKSELSVGYATLYGDMAGGFALLKDVYKTDVFRLARYLNERFQNGLAGKAGEASSAASQAMPQRERIPQSIIDRAPSAELRDDQLDEDSLPPYPALDQVLEAYVELDRSREDLTTDGFDPDVVERALAMIDRAEYKRRQAPPGVKLRPKAFGRDWRLPITNRWRG
jgi:NAD+ synthase (glutamine-hydrolysing)